MMVGKTILHYKIIEELGRGGMGVVYKAEDTKLKRHVAIKFLPKHISADSEERERFKIEAQSAAALSHPNIATIHAIEEFDDEMFIVMEYIDGEELKNRIDSGSLIVDESLDIAIQIAKGLQAAHENGIVHRDIKSTNIMIKKDGQAKIMDFGLAKVRGGKQITKVGTTLGTAAYMSPEQTRGEEVDHRGDIWSLGVVLYEMLTRKLPFKGDYDAALVYSILNETPQSILTSHPDLPTDLNQIVQHLLQKNLEDRYQNLDDFIADLRRIQGAPASDSQSTITTMTAQKTSDIENKQPSGKFNIPKIAIGFTGLIILILAGYLFLFPKDEKIDSLAVLPFVNVNADENTEYLSDGMTESIINSLTRIPDLRVVPRSIVFQYKGKNPDIREVGTQLDVGAVLTGRLVHRGQELNIQVDLVDIRKQSQIWGEQYSRNIKEILPLQQEIVTNVSDHLRLVLSGGVKQEIDKRPTENPEAYQHYLQGRYFWNKRKAPDLEKAIEFFNKAIEIDPNYALAYAGLADSYLLQEQYANKSMKEILPKAEIAGRKALEIDNSLAEAHTSLGLIYNMSWNWNKAEEEYKKALELKSDYATAHHWYAILLWKLNRPVAALGQALMAVQGDPVSIPINATVGVSYLRLNEYDKALTYFNKTAEIDSTHFVSYTYTGLIQLWQGNKVESLDNLEKGARLANRSAETLGSLGYAYAYLGKRKKAFEIIDELQTKFGKLSAVNIAEVYAGLGDIDKIVEWLNVTYQEKSGNLIRLSLPIWAEYRSDARFIAALQKFNLAP